VTPERVAVVTGAAGARALRADGLHLVVDRTGAIIALTSSTTPPCMSTASSVVARQQTRR
jgi:hypothetical protein